MGIFDKFRKKESEIRESVDVPRTKPVEVEHPAQQPEIDQSIVYRSIIEICQKSQETMNRRIKVAGVQALAETEPYESMWREYTERIPQPVELRQKNFSGLLFKNAWHAFKNHHFIECDFNGSRWVFSLIEDGNCAGSNFSRINAVPGLFKNTDCTNCDFSNAQIRLIDPFTGNNFRNANFTNAELNSTHSFFKETKLISRDIFENAVMNGCRLTIKKEKQPRFNRTQRELRLILQTIFSPDQLAVMHVDYDI